MASDAEIASEALTMLGAKPINALTDDSDQARLVNRHWADVRDEVLSDHPWPCATFRVQMVQLATGPVWGPKYAYQLPTDPYCLRVLATDLDVDEGGSGTPWSIEGRTLVTDASAVKLKYIGRVLNVDVYDLLLKGAMAAKLAFKIAYAVTRQEKRTEDMAKLYTATLLAAETMVGQARSQRRYHTRWLSEVR